MGAHVSGQFRTPCSWSPAGQAGSPARRLQGPRRVSAKSCCPDSSGGCGYGGDRSVGAASLGRIGRPTPSDIRHWRRSHRLPLCTKMSLWGHIRGQLPEDGEQLRQERRAVSSSACLFVCLFVFGCVGSSLLRRLFSRCSEGGCSLAHGFSLQCLLS